MAISLSELTGASTSGNVLNEVNSYADFLDSVPRLVNKADPSGNTDAVQTVATKQPIALPLDANGKGYLFQPNVLGNAPAVEFPWIGGSDDFVLEMDVYLADTSNLHFVSGANAAHRVAIYNGLFYIGGLSVLLSSSLSLGVSNIKIERTSGTITLKQNDVAIASRASSDSLDFTHLSFNGQYGGTSILPLYGYIQTATLSINGTEQLNIDFTSPRIPHGATEFTCETGQVVTVNQDSSSSSNIATIIKKSVLRFDGVNGGLHGFFANNISGGYMFAAFSVLGDGGGDYGRVLSVNATGENDYQNNGFVFANRGNLGTELKYHYNGNGQLHLEMYDDDRGDILFESKIASGAQKSSANGGNFLTTSVTATKSANEFNIGENEGDELRNSGEKAAIDLEYLAVFPATLTDSQADQVRNFINNRNKVFYRWDTDGYYFYDAAATVLNQDFVSSGAGSWNGRIVGSDFGDADNPIGNGTQTDRPTTDGYKVTFADNTDHFDFSPKTQAGWQIVGTSLGTFAYKINSDQITSFNLLGNETGSSYYYRKLGDLYGIILLPENATNRDIEEARKLLIDRGAADGATTITSAWNSRYDIVEFGAVDTSSVTSFNSAWIYCTSLASFPAIDASNGSDFTNAWRSCSSLTQFPQDAKLGTEASNVNFTNAWRLSGLTSFPALDLSKGDNFNYAWQDCSSLQSFPEDALLGNEVTGSVSFYSAWKNCDALKEFHTPLPNATLCRYAWYSCAALKKFSSSLPKVTNMFQAFMYSGNLETFEVDEMPEVTDVRYAWRQTKLSAFNTKMPKASRILQGWRACSQLVDFSSRVFEDWNPSSIDDAVFGSTWEGCTSLTAQSVENILVPIANSGKWATTNGTSGGNPITDATIDIDYKAVDPNNPAITYPLTAATLSAIETLNGRGWSVNINGVIQ